MRYQHLDIRNDNSLEGAEAILYAHEDYEQIPIHARPVVVICPGGGYDHLSVREGEIVAMQFLARGYQAVLLRYSCAPARYPTALLELAATVRTLRSHAAEWQIEASQVYVMGFSAGGHLVASYCAFWQEDFVAEALGTDTSMLRPDGQLLCYPVITSGRYAHEGSFRSLLGEDYEAKKEGLSLEQRVSASVPRTFLWHTAEDGSVPPQNSLLYVNALLQAGISVEYHLFPKGRHGLSLGRRISSRAGDLEVEPSVQPWIELACAWIGEPDTVSEREA